MHDMVERSETAVVSDTPTNVRIPWKRRSVQHAILLYFYLQIYYLAKNEVVKVRKSCNHSDIT